MLLTEVARSSRVRGRRSSGVGPRRKTRIISPSRVGNGRPEFLEEVPFGAFGRFGEKVLQPKPECSADITRWLALHEDAPWTSLQQTCPAENPSWFAEWRTLRLFDCSLRLPADEIAVHVQEEPHVIGGNPPRCVLNRWTQAILECPSAAGFYVEPYFDEPLDAEAAPLTAESLRKIVDGQWAVLQQRAERWRWLFRAERYVRLTIEAVVSWHSKRKQARLRRLLARRRLLEEQQERMARFNQRLYGGRSLRLSADGTRQVRPFRMPVSANAREAMQIERELARLAPGLLERGALPLEDIRRMNRRTFNTAVLLGIVPFPDGILRRDPLLLISRPEDNGLLRLVAHWDEWEVMQGGRKVKKTFVHV